MLLVFDLLQPALPSFQHNYILIILVTMVVEKKQAFGKAKANLFDYFLILYENLTKSKLKELLLLPFLIQYLHTFVEEVAMHNLYLSMFHFE